MSWPRTIWTVRTIILGAKLIFVAFAANVFDELALAKLGKAALDRAQRNLSLGDDIRGVAARIRLNAGKDSADFLLRGNSRLLSWSMTSTIWVSR